MELHSEESQVDRRGLNSLDALKSLTRLLVYEIESLAESSLVRSSSALDKEIDLNDHVQRYEASLIRQALIKANGNQARAAKNLGIKCTTLHAKIRRYGIGSMKLPGEFGVDNGGASVEPGMNNAQKNEDCAEQAADPNSPRDRILVRKSQLKPDSTPRLPPKLQYGGKGMDIAL